MKQEKRDRICVCVKNMLTFIIMHDILFINSEYFNEH